MKQRCRQWAPFEVELLKTFYPDVPARLLADELDRTVPQVHSKAKKLGLSKSAAFMASDLSGRVQRGKQDPRMRATQFKPGQIPANKGLRRPGWFCGRMRETQFKKGRPANESPRYAPIGTEQVNAKRGVLMRKMTDDPSIYPAARWTPVHVLVWEAEHGPIPEGHFVRFKAGMKSLIASEITLDRLELVTPAENLHRNSFHRWPDELKDVLYAKGRLTRAINRKSREVSE